MLEKNQMKMIISDLCSGLTRIFPGEEPEAILFGSYARGDADEGSDVDVLVLLDSTKEMIAQKEWEVGNIAGDILLNYGVLVSPVVENRKYYIENSSFLPFFRNIEREGVRVYG
ncbi:MAG: nucleotidyltransferase domain-containing protein [Clostridia bacterium]|nr:nucleotidyltransferase domain-containing protein [Clostridia bacterium]